MIDERFEFEIAQLADGTLQADRVESVRARILGSNEARSLLESYEKMHGGFRGLPSLPAIDWNRFTMHVGSHLDASDRDIPASYPMVWLKRAAGLAAAACVLIGAGVAIRMHTPIAKSSNAGSVRGQIAVAGPAIEAPAGQMIQQITIGPSVAVAAAGDNLQYGDAGVVVQPSRVVIASAVDAAQDSAQDSNATPY